MGDLRRDVAGKTLHLLGIFDPIDDTYRLRTRPSLRPRGEVPDPPVTAS
ncbi:hypothetical protein [Nonomuraea polychroma]|nr:hypothetical protein [Nonomuraea polychroma]